MVSAEVIRMHFDYSRWASARLLNAAAQLSAEELTHGFGTADKSVHGTLVMSSVPIAFGRPVLREYKSMPW